jgi:hypothetical protein
MKPQRIQLSRKKGWRLPPNTVVVSRPTKWGNPLVVTPETPRELVVKMFRHCITSTEGPAWVKMRAEISELRGKNLACWCKIHDANGVRVPCHADILLSIANDIPLEEICAPLTTPN